MNVQADATIFQAIGLIKGIPFQDDVLGWAIELDKTKYRLFIPQYLYRGWLKEMTSNPQTPFYLRVYPKCFIAPKQPPEIHFYVIAWNKNNEAKEKINIFSLRGLWQFIPQSRLPVLTVYRNKGAKDITKRFKASHLPVLMRREDAQPYKFNAKSEDKATRYFIQGEFALIHEKQAFGYRRDLDSPTLEAPRYKKPIKLEAGNKVKAVKSKPGKKKKAITTK